MSDIGQNETMLLLEVKNLTVAYDTAVILDEVSVGVHKGELLSIVGPNGAGKTTLMRTICGLMTWEREMKRGMRKEVSNIIIKGISCSTVSPSIQSRLIRGRKRD
jgi:ABC-type cobalamin/Fe3+-siderophores transport system ATPase subunit